MKLGRMPVATNSPNGRGRSASTPMLLELKDLLHGDHVPFHADDLGDAGHLARPALQPAGLDDQVDGGGDLLAAARVTGRFEPGHADHRLEPRQGVARRVGVDGGHRAVVAGVHGLEHVERLGAAALADDDPVGPHAQGVAHQVAGVICALALDVRRAGSPAGPRAPAGAAARPRPRW